MLKLGIWGGVIVAAAGWYVILFGSAVSVSPYSFGSARLPDAVVNIHTVSIGIGLVVSGFALAILAAIFDAAQMKAATLNGGHRDGFAGAPPAGVGAPRVGVGFGFDAIDGRGALVISMLPDGPSDRAGLMVDDLITAVDGQDISLISTVRVGYLLRGPEGTNVELTVSRGEGVHSISVRRGLLEGLAR